jgi:hypothetical protein
MGFPAHVRPHAITGFPAHVRPLAIMGFPAHVRPHAITGWKARATHFAFAAGNNGAMLATTAAASCAEPSFVKWTFFGS